MNNTTRQLQEHLDDLAEALRPFSAIETVRTLLFNIDNLPPPEEGAALARPVAIALIGGTGVGKSSLFNLLAGGELSPVAIERACTTRPIVALPPAARPHLSPLIENNARTIDTPESHLALIDTPDIDSFLTRHHALAHQVIDLADIIIYVTNPNKRAADAAWHIPRTWGSRKRWLFVLNQSDMLEQPDAARQEWINLLQREGFPADASNVFLTDARHPDTFDFQRLDQHIQSRHSTEQLEHLRRDAWLSRLVHALEPDHADTLAETAARSRRLIEHTGLQLHQTVEQAWPAICRQTAPATRLIEPLIWQHLAHMPAGLMAPCIWLHNLFAGLRSINPFALASRSSQNTRRANKAWQQIARSENAGQLTLRIKDLLDNLRREHEDLALPATALPAPDRDFQPLDTSTGELEQAAEQAARKTMALPWRIIDHLAPLAVTAFSFRRMMLDYYQHAIFQQGAITAYLFMLALSLLPGYWLLRARIARHARQTGKTDLKQAILRSIREKTLDPLEKENHHLETLAESLRSCRTHAQGIRDLERRHLQEAPLGIPG